MPNQLSNFDFIIFLLNKPMNLGFYLAFIGSTAIFPNNIVTGVS